MADEVGTVATPPEHSPRVVPSLYDYGLIGNLHTAALVSRNGSIDWACLPRFSSPSVFGRLLDAEKGGFFSIRPVEPSEGHQRYLPSTNILETRFELSGGRTLTLVDFMPAYPRLSHRESAVIVRIAKASEAPVEIEVVVEPRFDYARLLPSVRSSRLGAVAEAGRDRLSVRLPGPPETGEGRISLRTPVEPGRPCSLEASWGGWRLPTPSPAALLRGTERFWRSWVHSPDATFHRVGGERHELVERSELLLKLLSHVDTGAFVAAPTTSLPEWPGGSRNWDYRYVWIRDAAFAAQEMILLGHLREARSFLSWVVQRLDAVGPDRGTLRVVYGAHGETDLTERTLLHLEGYRGAKPVRVGNGAADQFQLDIFGELLDAAWVLAQLDPGFIERRRSSLLDLTDRVLSVWGAPDQGIWESRGPPAEYVHSKLMAWVALDRAARIAERIGGDARVDRWRSAADEVRTVLLRHGFDDERRTFVQAFGSHALDAANLRIPLVGFLPFDDPRVTGTVDRILEGLTEGPFVYRYRAPDGIDEPEGAFLPCSFWLVECLARSGRSSDAYERFEALCAVASPLGLFPEEFDPKGRVPLGNYPQAFTHVAFLRAALAVGQALAPPAVRAGVERAVLDPGP